MGLFAIFDMKIVLFYLIHSIENGMNSFSTIINDVNVAPAIAIPRVERHMTIPLLARLRKITISLTVLGKRDRKEKWDEKFFHSRPSLNKI